MARWRRTRVGGSSETTARHVRNAKLGPLTGGKEKCFDGPNHLKRNADRSATCCLQPRLFTAGIRFYRTFWPLWGRVQQFKSASAGHERQDGRCKQRKGHKPLSWAATLNPEWWEACQKSIFFTNHFILLIHTQGSGVQSVFHDQMFFHFFQSFQEGYSETVHVLTIDDELGRLEQNIFLPASLLVKSWC